MFVIELMRVSLSETLRLLLTPFFKLFLVVKSHLRSPFGIAAKLFCRHQIQIFLWAGIVIRMLCFLHVLITPVP
ncbi:MAG: hypothetical protein CME32_31675 [Gimesia sp.]|nr:hypothetical protein [Gimesia sp.]